MVAISAFECGVDVSDVSIVLHVGIPYSLPAYAQESSRAGRNEKMSQSITVTTRQTTGQEKALSTAVDTGSEESDRGPPDVHASDTDGFCSMIFWTKAVCETVCRWKLIDTSSDGRRDEAW